MTRNDSFRSEGYNIQNQADKAKWPSERSEQHHFITLGKISEEEKIEIIQTGLKVYF